MPSPLRFPADRPFLLAGPCVIESEAHTLTLARAIKAIADRAGLPFVFKASFDKANRTSIHSYRGPGLAEGLRILALVRDELGCPVMTDFHEPAQAAPVANVCAVLQVPAFLCRQTDMIVAAARTGAVVNIKKGQFVAPEDMAHSLEKATESGAAGRVWLTERGSSFGYHNLVMDPRSLVIMRGLGAPVVFDATHSVQIPSAGGKSGGRREFIEPLVRAAAAVGIDGLFLEVHDNPDAALSDAASQLPIERLPALLETYIRIDAARRASEAPR